MRRGLRWLAPVASSGAVAAYALVPALLAGHVEHPRLPTVTAADLLGRLQRTDVPGLSGTVHESADLGLPALPAADATTALGLLTGSRTLQVAEAGYQARVAVLAPLSEQDYVLGDQGLWTYDSTTGRATHLPTGRLPAATPRRSAQDALAAIDPTTEVTVDRTARIAGRDAYTLVLTPRQTGTLVGRVEIAVDATTGTPLRTAVYAAGRTDPAFEAAFTAISYAVPAARTFDPPGAPLAASSSSGAGAAGAAGLVAGLLAGSGSATASPTTIGSGWTAVHRLTGIPATAAVQQQLRRLGTPVPQGVLISTRLLTVLVTPTGTAYVGAVPPATLQALAS